MAQIFGRQAFVDVLHAEGVTHLFGNPGTTELPIMQALPQRPELKFVLGLQESVVVAMADGFARASRQLTAANVHVAPGLGNAKLAQLQASLELARRALKEELSERDALSSPQAVRDYLRLSLAGRDQENHRPSAAGKQSISTDDFNRIHRY